MMGKTRTKEQQMTSNARAGGRILGSLRSADGKVHVEDLAAHLAGRPRCDGEARSNELMPAYQNLAADVS
jgi:hypothetical protein